MSNGKGDGRRPAQVDDATLADNWARTFGRTPTAPPQGQDGGTDAPHNKAAVLS